MCDLPNSTDRSAAVNVATLAQTSYVANASMTPVDNTSNNLSDLLQVNVTLVAKTTSNYTLQLTLVDPTNNSMTASNWTGTSMKFAESVLFFPLSAPTSSSSFPSPSTSSK